MGKHNTRRFQNHVDKSFAWMNELRDQRSGEPVWADQFHAIKAAFQDLDAWVDLRKGS